MNTKELANRYRVQCCSIALLLHLAVTGVAWLLDGYDVVNVPSLVGAYFSVLCGILISVVWRKVAENSEDMLTTFYSATHAFRMLLALAVLTVCFFIVGRDAMTPYVLVFMGYYLIFIAHHAVYFARITNNKSN